MNFEWAIFFILEALITLSGFDLMLEKVRYAMKQKNYCRHT
jgi:hypothetical protein